MSKIVIRVKAHTYSCLRQSQSFKRWDNQIRRSIN